MVLSLKPVTNLCVKSGSEPLTPIHKWSTFFTPHLFCRDNIIQPMEVDSEGKLVPMSGLRENSLTEEGRSESGVDGETEEGEKD